ncbi:MAG: SNF2-related protein [Candidatus Eisenbacteria bacterium]|nr:SNF2-related protein [Candidatus Eisenbacteria bacterium]
MPGKVTEPTIPDPAHLLRRCLEAFSESARESGQAFQRDGKVKLGSPGPTGISARIQDTDDETIRPEVDWSWADTRALLWASCSCEDFEEGNACNHLWALLAAMDERGLARLVPGRGPLEVLDDDKEDDEATDEPTPSGPLIAAKGRRQESSRWYRPSDPSATRSRPPGGWKYLIQSLDAPTRPAPAPEFGVPRPLTPIGPIWYLLNESATRAYGELVIEFHRAGSTRRSTESPLKPVPLGRIDLTVMTEAVDREILTLLLGGNPDYDDTFASQREGDAGRNSRLGMPAALLSTLVPRLCATTRFGRPDSTDSRALRFQPLAFDDGPAWQCRLTVESVPGEDAWMVDGTFFRSEERMPLTEPVLVMKNGFLVRNDVVGFMEPGPWHEWIELIRRTGPVRVPRREKDEFLRLFWASPLPPAVEVPEDLKLAEATATAVPRLVLTRPPIVRTRETLDAALWFDYEGGSVAHRHPARAIVQVAAGRVIPRDVPAEAAARALLVELGFKEPVPPRPAEAELEIAVRHLATVARVLVGRGWQVEAEGQRYRAPGIRRMTLSSGIDWFDLTGAVDFGGQEATLPELLAAARKGQDFVLLGDGSRGLLPEDWLERLAPLADLGTPEGDGLRFHRSQATLLDALLESQPEVDRDADFRRLIERLNAHHAIAPVEQPAGFVGQLREYQRLGLGWLQFLAEFSFGGCLADDMGLGKTIQVLALLEGRRRARGPKTPSLVVVPRSLVHNWIEEAGRFTPELKMLDYTGQDRADQLPRFDDFDLVVTTYGTVRRDILKLKDYRFDYVILDEAQAIKNSGSQASRACRLLEADHRLAMSGTPVENHLGELGALFEFLNPGMLGRAAAARARVAGASDPESVALLARALKPFILRRTKEQVLSELPIKTEQTLYCELEPKQRRMYDSMRAQYRASLSATIQKLGLSRAKVHVLEALLRLRQVACHPGLVDKALVGDSSAKLDTLFESLREIVDEGHKALVFSQFTSLLAIVRPRLDQEGIRYEYLDGKTTKRSEKVKRFQEDPTCPLFLISLKAGGQGLNLTAADYVFILDPWWNPAVEAQAVDRAHRIGQTRPVFAYRLIARDTVEEKIVELQRNKRHLADAIISADSSLLRSLTAEDLQRLLS